MRLWDALSSLPSLRPTATKSRASELNHQMRRQRHRYMPTLWHRAVGARLDCPTASSLLSVGVTVYAFQRACYLIRFPFATRARQMRPGKSLGPLNSRAPEPSPPASTLRTRRHAVLAPFCPDGRRTMPARSRRQDGGLCNCGGSHLELLYPPGRSTGATAGQMAEKASCSSHWAQIAGCSTWLGSWPEATRVAVQREFE